MCFALFCLSLIFVTGIDKLEVSNTYKLVAITCQMNYPIIIILNYFGKIYLARLTFSVIAPIWSCTSFLFIGGNFGLELTIVAAMTMTYVSFTKRPRTRNILLAFQTLSYLFVTWFVVTHGSIYTNMNFPFDEVIVFFASIGWMVVVMTSHAKNNQRLVDQLTDRNKALKATSEELEKFTYIASHDLKSPLRTITSFVGLAKRKLKKERYEDAKEDLSFIENSAIQMTNLVESILEYAKLNDNDKKDFEHVDLNEVFELSKQHMSVDIKTKNAIVTCDPLPQFYCHKFDVMRMFQNFMQNGIKYNEDESPSVHLSSKIVDNHLILSFSDNGIGIDEQYHDYVFRFFKRLHNSDKYGGSGMGLGIVNKIVNGYGGRIKVNSKVGHGSTFSISLPYDLNIQRSNQVIPKHEMELQPKIDTKRKEAMAI